MARIRTIKPEFFTSEDIVSMTPLARLFYVSLWCEADRAGRLEWKPATLKIRYLPVDNIEINDLAQELIERGLIVVYEVDGKKYAEIPSFEKHQVINNREAESTRPSRVSHASPRVKAEGKGRERKERNGTEPASFTRFWDAWPKSERKQDRKKCADKWVAKNLEPLIDQILADIATKQRTQKWQGGFIEAPEVYLNNERWNDEVTPDEPKKDIAQQTVPSRPGRDPALIKAEEDAKRAAPIPPQLRETIAKLTGRAVA